MRRVGFLFLFLSFTLIAATPAEQFRTAYAQWTAHRPDGMTWDDDSATAVQALNTMWSTAAQVGVDFLATQKSATAQELSKELSSLRPEADPKIAPPLSTSTLEIRPGFFLLAFDCYPAGTVFAIARQTQGAAVIWAISQGGAQTNDPRHLLASWHASRAGNSCVNSNKYASGICGPMTSVSLGSLPPNRSGDARFFIKATYSKDMGGTLDQQISIWSLKDQIPELDWINLYAEGGDDEAVPNGIEFKDGMLLIAEKHEFDTFPSCGSCSGRQRIHRIRVTPDGVQDDGLRSVHPELDILDNLFRKIAKRQTATGLASEQVVNFLRPQLLTAERQSHEVDPNWFSVGMLIGFTFSPGAKISSLCFQSDELGPLEFTFLRTADSYFVSHVSDQPHAKRCEEAH